MEHTVRCCNCNWSGQEEDLVPVPEENHKGCPDCGNGDKALTDCFHSVGTAQQCVHAYHYGTLGPLWFKDEHVEQGYSPVDDTETFLEKVANGEPLYYQWFNLDFHLSKV